MAKKFQLVSDTHLTSLDRKLIDQLIDAVNEGEILPGSTDHVFSKRISMRPVTLEGGILTIRRHSNIDGWNNGYSTIKLRIYTIPNVIKTTKEEI